MFCITHTTLPNKFWIYSELVGSPIHKGFPKAPPKRKQFIIKQYFARLFYIIAVISLNFFWISFLFVVLNISIRTQKFLKLVKSKQRTFILINTSEKKCVIFSKQRKNNCSFGSKGCWIIYRYSSVVIEFQTSAGKDWITKWKNLYCLQVKYFAIVNTVILLSYATLKQMDRYGKVFLERS